jgi:hypothetical protein
MLAMISFESGWSTCTRAIAEPPGLSRPRWKVAILTLFSPSSEPSRPMKPGLSSLVI